MWSWAAVAGAPGASSTPRCSSDSRRVAFALPWRGRRCRTRRASGSTGPLASNPPAPSGTPATSSALGTPCSGCGGRLPRARARRPSSPDRDPRRALDPARPEVVEGLARGLERIAAHVGADRNARREREQRVAVGARQVRHGAQGALAPKDRIRKGGDVGHVDAGAHNRAALGGYCERGGHELPDGSEDDGGVERFGWLSGRLAGPLGPELSG